MERVYLKKAEDYGNSGAIERSVASLLDNCGMDLDYRGKKVVVKPNMLRKCRPEDRITTDPSVIAAVLIFSNTNLSGKYERLIASGKTEEAGQEFEFYLHQVEACHQDIPFEKTEAFTDVFGDVSLPEVTEEYPCSLRMIRQFAE